MKPDGKLNWSYEKKKILWREETKDSCAHARARVLPVRGGEEEEEKSDAAFRTHFGASRKREGGRKEKIG